MWGSMIGAGISAGSSLLGGLLGRSSAKKEARRARKWAAHREDTRLQRLRKDADAAGVNVLTALRGGAGAGGYVTHAPSLGGDTIASALGLAGDALARGVQAAFDYDPLDERRSNLELEIQEATLRNLNQQMSGLGAAPVATGMTRTSAGGGVLGGTSTPDIGRTSVTNPHNPSSGWRVNPDYLDAQAFEERYGDIVQQFAGVRNAIADFQYNQSIRVDDRPASVLRAGRPADVSSRRLNPTTERGQWFLGLPTFDQFRRFNRRARINNIYRSVHGR